VRAGGALPNTADCSCSCSCCRPSKSAQQPCQRQQPTCMPDPCLLLLVQPLLSPVLQALADAQWHPSTPEQQAATGVSMGAGMSCTSEIAEAGALIAAAKLRRVSPYFVPRILVNMAAGAVSIRHQLRGPNHAVSTACATGVHCIGDAFRMVQRGDAEVMLAGVESP
jgi:3-oxoacyl-(acyl-carrier-protein) synthase